ncbi:hypothetical protein HBO40_18370 [Pseudomonas protegens]|uniref:hypothetical protein n=1 Tax=Pseudomonas protegens TaxID=380021 RepID=UPI001474B5E7|nr:hypothetical protein [Pseudomonas protegens]NMZ29609.1 hypothetical protein [Pseudomonas protegens]NMZ86651.1 hypothetical protein [Pseudomonas protegens]
MNILILDDETPRANLWKSTLESFTSCQFTVYNVQQVSDLIGELHRARFESRSGNFKAVNTLDEFDLIIIDYDLLGLETVHPAAWATGAEIAYTIRLMCNTGPIVVVNQVGTNSFDLTMRRTVSSYADLDVGSAQITDQGLWVSEAFQEFRPWHWPDLHKEVERFKNTQSFVLEHFDQPIMKTLGFEIDDSDSPAFLNYEIAAFIGATQHNQITFRDIVMNNAALRVFNILEKDHEILKTMPDDQLARVCSAILLHWLEKVLLPAQEVISDAPHLAIQIPWIIDNPEDISNWSSLCSLNNENIPKKLVDHSFNPGFLFSRPVFWGEKAKREISMPGDFEFSRLPQIQFSENTSSFTPEDNLTSFPSDVLAFDRKRWVWTEKSSGADHVNYEPQSYLLM